MRILLLCSYLLLIPGLAAAQVRLSGQVRDAHSGEPLAFATVIYDLLGKAGTITDLDGYFVLELDARPSRLRVSHLGYAPLVLTGPALEAGALDIRLEPVAAELRPVEIAAERDPALALIRTVIDRWQAYDPARLPAYACRVYARFFFDWLPATDSAGGALQGLMARTALLLMESETERRYLRPGRVAETVVANRVSGFQAPGFAALATDFQPFSWYQDLIPLLDHQYLNPLASGAPDRYVYRLADTLVEAGDTLVGVQFGPRAGSTFDALTGLLRIHLGDRALYSVEAWPETEGPITLRIEQRYQRVRAGVWFPEQLNFDLRMPDYPSPGLGVQGEGRSYVQAIDLDPSWRRRDLGPDQVRMADDATQKPLAYWDSVRVRPLSPREQQTYHVLDSLGAARNFDRKLEAVAKLSRGRWQLRHVDVDLDQVWRFNSYEGHRLGLGLRNPGTWLKWLEVGGYGAYGFRDQAWKYGGDLLLHLNRDREWQWGVAAARDVLEPGQSGLRPQVALNDLRSYATARMDSVRSLRTWMHLRFLTFATVEAGVSYHDRNPAYGYAWRRQPGETAVSAFGQWAGQVRLRYAYREELVEVFGRRVSQGSRFPVLQVAWETGLPAWRGSSFAYHRLEGRVSQRFHTRWGSTQLVAEAGWVQGDVPANLLFYGAGTRSPEVWLVAPGYFQTMTPYAFLHDRYAHLFWQHRWAAPLWRLPLSQPRLMLFQGVGWGRLAQPERHEGIAFRTMEKGYYETGLVLDQLIRINYLNIGYMGIGGGAFLTYGPNQGPRWQDNLVGKVSLTFSSR